MENKSKPVINAYAKLGKKENYPVNEKPIEIQLEVKKPRKPAPAPSGESLISLERLQEAIIWSEILGKPLSKRRKRR